VMWGAWNRVRTRHSQLVAVLGLSVMAEFACWPAGSPGDSAISTTTSQNKDREIMTSARGNNSQVNALNLTNVICTPYSVQFTSLTDACKRAYQPLNGQSAQHKKYMSDAFTTIEISTDGMGPENKTGFALYRVGN
jgi:hypothetical protein